MFGDKARRIEELGTLLTHTRLMKDYYAERNLVLEKELRITNKACRNKKKLSKALHEANKKIKELERRLFSEEIVRRAYSETVSNLNKKWMGIDVSFIDEKPPAPAEHATKLPNCT